MKFIQKNLLYSFLITTNIVLCFSVFFQNNDSTFSNELNLGINITKNYYSSDTETYDDEQILQIIKKQKGIIIDFKSAHFHRICLLSYPSFTVWQPPNC